MTLQDIRHKDFKRFYYTLLSVVWPVRGETKCAAVGDTVDKIIKNNSPDCVQTWAEPVQRPLQHLLYLSHYNDVALWLAEWRGVSKSKLSMIQNILCHFVDQTHRFFLFFFCSWPPWERTVCDVVRTEALKSWSRLTGSQIKVVCNQSVCIFSLRNFTSENVFVLFFFFFGHKWTLNATTHWSPQASYYFD